MKISKIILVTIFSFIATKSYASMCSAHSSDDENISTVMMTYNTPCEISDTVLMASSEEVCKILKEKISNHDHD